MVLRPKWPDMLGLLLEGALLTCASLVAVIGIESVLSSQGVSFPWSRTEVWAAGALSLVYLVILSGAYELETLAPYRGDDELRFMVQFDYWLSWFLRFGGSAGGTLALVALVDLTNGWKAIIESIAGFLGVLCCYVLCGAYFDATRRI